MTVFRNEKGQATVDFLVISLLLFAILFGAVDYWVAMVRIQQGEHVKNFYLDRVRLEGTLLPQDQTELKAAFSRIGFNVVEVDAPPDRVIREIGWSTELPEVWLNVTTEFCQEPFMMGLFLGKENKLQPQFKGRVLSEYAGL